MASKFRKKLAGFVCNFVPTKKARSAVRDFIENPNITGRIKHMRDGRALWNAEKLRKKSNAKYQYNLSVLAIVKDEGPYLREWIEYHRIVGVDKFYIYDNESSDNTAKILAPYIKEGIVDYTYWPGQAQQLPAYADWLVKHKMDTKWVAIIDLDEFILPISEKSIVDYLDGLALSTSALVVHWFMFGSNGHDKKPDGLVVESYTKRAKKKHYHYKSIVNPRLCHSLHVHKHDNVGRTIYIPEDKMRINHYHCKSWQEYQFRKTRGCAFRGKEAAQARYTREFFDARDTNDVSDTLILERYLEQLKERLSD